MTFEQSYAAAASRWPTGTESFDAPTSWGRTHVLTVGPPDGVTLVLLHGGHATATVWADVAQELSGRFRLLAPDQPGSPGRSLSSRPFRTAADITAWLAELLAAMGTGPWHLVGHSAGAHLALSCALDRPDAVASLSLLDPTASFAGFSPRYLLHALPHLVRPTADRVRRFFAWETGGRALDPAWLEVCVRGSTEFESTPLVRTPRPRRTDLATLGAPALVLIAGRSRAHDPRRVAAGAAVLPDVTVAEVAGASHHTMPVLDAREIAAFVAAHVDAHPVRGAGSA